MGILLVEDDERIVQFLRRGLRTEGYRVELAATGEDAVTLAGSAEFQLIILDLALPDINGLEVCSRLRARRIDTPVLMLTAMDTVQDKVAGLRSGADDYLTKPFAFEELLARIETLLRRREGTSKSEVKELRVGSLVLNRETHAVQRESVPINLTPKEFALLECFMSAPGKVMSRTRILEQVWGYSADPLTNVVDVYIRQLRRKIDDPFDQKLLVTVRGYGYKLDGPS
jgi:DNA-binding response OmpR family regulator